MDEVVRTQQEETFGVFGRDVAIYDCIGPRFFSHFAQWLVWQLCCRICIFVIIILAIIGCANTVTSHTPSNLVVTHWTSAVESTAPLDFL